MATPDLDRPGRTYRGADLQQRREQRRAQLLAAAVEVFGTTGYRTATVERVCSAAGLTKRYYYESFDSSEDLLLAAYVLATDALRSAIVDGAASAPGERPLVDGALRGFFSAIADDPRLARIAFFEILGVSTEVDRVYREVTRSFVDDVLTLAGDIVRGTSLPRAQLLTVATGLVGAVLLIAQQWVLTDLAEPLDTVLAGAQTIAAAVLDALPGASR